MLAIKIIALILNLWFAFEWIKIKGKNPEKLSKSTIVITLMVFIWWIVTLIIWLFK